ncbi:MAG: hypothetical protein RR435_05030 [Erysipelotrichaceae bacterium]
MNNKKVITVIAFIFSIFMLIYFNIAQVEIEKNRPDPFESEEVMNDFKEAMAAEETAESKERDRLRSVYNKLKDGIDLHGLYPEFNEDGFYIYEGKGIDMNDKLIFKSRMVKAVHYTGDEFLVLQYERVLKEFSTKERKLTGVEYEDIDLMYIDGDIPVAAFYKDGEVTLYNKEGSKNTPFKCTKEKLHTKPSITYRGGENFEFVE